ncbi:MAG: aminotransferase class I/II-fold pyridoxal phosphate-dependent enzyme [Acidimicrobiia bacterium]
MPSAESRIVAAVVEATPDGIAKAIGVCVSSGALAAGTRLPTVRDLAGALAVSPSTVGEAWQILRRHKVIETDGRRGSFIRDRTGGPTTRYWQVPVRGDAISYDLSSGIPDASLLPNPHDILAELDSTPSVSSYVEAPVAEELEGELLRIWPFAPARMTVLNGAMDAMDRILGVTAQVGDLIGVSDPGFPPIFDMIETAGAVPYPIDLDGEGLLPDSVAGAVDAGIGILFVQPRGHNPTGASMTPRRRDELLPILERSGVLVIEDDHSGMVAGAPLVSFGDALPDRVLHIHSFSKSHGPDLRLAAVGGPAEPIIAVERRRSLGPSWSSRLLQRILAAMLASEEVNRSIEHAASEYAQRRATFVEDLAAHGIEVDDGDGLNAWVPVDDEAFAVPMLAAHGIGVARGKPFQLRGEQGRHVRVTTSTYTEQAREIIGHIAQAARGRMWPEPTDNGGIR